ncbi:hypothetical protein C8J56DRAFT_947764 [Mycena floridula]|nr:hypothetical protein C8J56DRAFT_947764 [Mycena floridula]
MRACFLITWFQVFLTRPLPRLLVSLALVVWPLSVFCRLAEFSCNPSFCILQQAPHPYDSLTTTADFHLNGQQPSLKKLFIALQSPRPPIEPAHYTAPILIKFCILNSG